MKYIKTLFFFLISVCISCCAFDATNKVWFTEAQSGSVIFNTNTTFSNSQEIAEADLPSMILSDETNYLKSGISIGYAPDLKSTNFCILIHNGIIANGDASLAMLNTSTNQIDYWTPWPKKSESQFEMSMVNDQGKPIKKTAFGMAFGRTPLQIPNSTPVYKAQGLGLHRSFIPPRGDDLYSLANFDPKKDIPKCFDLKQSGNYKFTLIHHIYVAAAGTNGEFLKPVTFSPVTIDVRVEIDSK